MLINNNGRKPQYNNVSHHGCRALPSWRPAPACKDLTAHTSLHHIFSCRAVLVSFFLTSPLVLLRHNYPHRILSRMHTHWNTMQSPVSTGVTTWWNLNTVTTLCIADLVCLDVTLRVSHHATDLLTIQISYIIIRWIENIIWWLIIFLWGTKYCIHKL